MFIIGGLLLVSFYRTRQQATKSAAQQWQENQSRQSSIVEPEQDSRRTSQQTSVDADRVLSIQGFTEALSHTLTISQVAEVSLSQSLAATGASAGSIMLLVDKNTVLQVINVAGNGQAGPEIGQSLALNAQHPVADAVRTGQPVWLNSGAAQPALYPALRNDGKRESLAAVPLTVNGEVIGGMELVFPQVRTFSQDDKVFTVLLAQKCAQAIDRARLYSEVHEQRERLQVTLASIGDAVITTDVKGHITFMNHVAEVLSGWNFDETSETSLHNVFRIINETTREPQEDPITKVIRENAVVGLANHTLLIAKDGSEMPIDDSGAPIRDLNGAIIGVILVFRDITERRKRETDLDATLQRTRDLYETCRRIGLVSSPEEVVQALLTSRYLRDTTQCAVLTYNALWNGEQPDGYEVTAISHADRPLPGFAANGSFNDSPLAAMLSRDDPIFLNDIRTDTRLDQEVRELFALTGIRSMMIFPLITGRRCFGTLLLYFGSPHYWSEEDHQHVQVFVDQICVTLDNVRLFAAEARARLDAEQANQIKLKFLAMISHELRTPLTSIKGFATTLLANDVTWDTESQRDFISIISEESDKLTDLINQLLDLSRLQAGKLRILPTVYSLHEIIDFSMAELGSLTAQHRLQIDLAPALPLIVVDKQRTAEVLVNLVGNAAQYAPPATHITITATVRQASLQVDVSDEGPGIPRENRERVFEAFLQLENGSDQHGKGLGLGLAICKGLIEAQGGRIWIADTSSGTTMSFTLPLATSQ